MEIKLTRDTKTMIARISGRVDTIAASAFQRTLEEALDGRPDRIIVNMEDMAYISSAGLRSVLIVCRKAQACRTTLVCCCMNQIVRKIFDVSGFSQLVKIVDTLDDAESIVI